ncbi:hypothetical protein NQ315_003500, partial [Exocentrus adspersus]
MTFEEFIDEKNTCLVPNDDVTFPHSTADQTPLRIVWSSAVACGKVALPALIRRKCLTFPDDVKFACRGHRPRQSNTESGNVLFLRIREFDHLVPNRVIRGCPHGKRINLFGVTITAQDR